MFSCKNFFSLIVCLGSLVGFLVCSAVVPERTLAFFQRGETKLNNAAEAIDKEASTSEGTTRVTRKLSEQFGADEEVITGLRDQGYGFGEIAIALSLAAESGKDVNTILAMKTDEVGWGKVAKESGVKLGRVVSSVRKSSHAIKREEERKTVEEKERKREKPRKRRQ
jgi:hypothetical protein